jgi:hypothetical protein
VPLQLDWKIPSLDEAAIDDVSRNPRCVADQPLTHRRLPAIATDQRAAVMAAPIGIDRGHSACGLLDIADARGRDELDPVDRLHTFKERHVHVGTMGQRIRIAEAPAERCTDRHVGDRRAVYRVHHHHPVGIDHVAACSFADAERVEGSERVRPELNACANLFNPARLFDNLDLAPFASECQRRCEAADAAADDKDRRFSRDDSHRDPPRSWLLLVIGCRPSVKPVAEP